MNKSGRMSDLSKLMWFVGIIAIAGLGLYAYSSGIFQGVAPSTPAATAVQTVTTTGTATPVTATVSCPNDKNVDGQARYIDLLSTNKDKVANIASFFIPNGRGDISRVSLGNSTATGDGYSTSVNVPCDVDQPISYTPIAVTKKYGDVSLYGYHSVSHPTVVAGKSDRLQVTFEGKRQDWLRLRGIDNQQPASTNALNNTNTTSCGAGCTSFAPINVDDLTTTGDPDNLGVLYRTTGSSGASGQVVNADDFLDLTFKLKTNNTKSQFGEDGLRTFMIVDADKSIWEVPVVSGHGSQKIEFSSLNVDDAAMLSNFEYIYQINPITEAEATINFYLKTASGVNPAATDDPSILFVVEGRYNSIEQLDAVRTSIYEDSSSNRQVAFNQANKIRIDVT